VCCDVLQHLYCRLQVLPTVLHRQHARSRAVLLGVCFPSQNVPVRLLGEVCGPDLHAALPCIKSLLSILLKPYLVRHVYRPVQYHVRQPE
jgi:hypothetical protein